MSMNRLTVGVEPFYGKGPPSFVVGWFADRN